MVVDVGWSKRDHKISYNINNYSGIGVIFGAATRALLFIGVRNNYCSLTTYTYVPLVLQINNVTVPPYQCYRTWLGSSCNMEADIVF